MYRIKQDLQPWFYSYFMQAGCKCMLEVVVLHQLENHLLKTTMFTRLFHLSPSTYWSVVQLTGHDFSHG